MKTITLNREEYSKHISLIDDNDEELKLMSIGNNYDNSCQFYRISDMWKILKSNFNIKTSFKDFCEMVTICRWTIKKEIKDNNQSNFNSFYGYAMNGGGGRKSVNKMYGNNYSSSPNIEFINCNESDLI